jgi:hypothetical protein
VSTRQAAQAWQPNDGGRPRRGPSQADGATRTPHDRTVTVRSIASLCGRRAWIIRTSSLADRVFCLLSRPAPEDVQFHDTPALTLIRIIEARFCSSQAIHGGWHPSLRLGYLYQG